ncbi:MAG: hypothetical protein JWQ66_926 [Mucilaginibacter sp.]|nr:hypothetical protein [Mucilaginibacter sp.]
MTGCSEPLIKILFMVSLAITDSFLLALVVV